MSSENYFSSWDNDTISYLRDLTRKYNFDFDKVAIDMTQYVQANNKSYIITSENCRAIYTEDYFSSEKEINNISTKDKSLDNLTYKEIIDLIELNNISYQKKQEEMFARVFESLKVDGYGQSLSEVMSPDMSSVILQFQTNKRLKEIEKQKLISRQQEYDERKYYESERLKLKNRFIDDPVDSFAENDAANSKSSLDSDIYKDVDIDFGFNVDHINMKEVFESKEFNRILDDIEKELAMIAPDKSDTELRFNSSELEEVFKVLDAASLVPRPVVPSANSNNLVKGQTNAKDNLNKTPLINEEKISEMSSTTSIRPTRDSNLIKQKQDEIITEVDDSDSDEDIDKWKNYRRQRKNELELNLSSLSNNDSVKGKKPLSLENHSKQIIDKFSASKVIKVKSDAINSEFMFSSIIENKRDEESSIEESSIDPHFENEEFEINEIVKIQADNFLSTSESCFHDTIVNSTKINDLAVSSRLEYTVEKNNLYNLDNESPWDNFDCYDEIKDESSDIHIEKAISILSGSLMKRKVVK